MVVAQLAETLLPIPANLVSRPGIVNVIKVNINCKEKTDFGPWL